MKKFAMAILSTATIFATANAAEVKTAHYNSESDSIDLSIYYGGGCKKHVFTLEVGGCLESTPAQCSVKLVDSGADDGCEAGIQSHISIPMSSITRSANEYTGAVFFIRGDEGSMAMTRVRSQKPSTSEDRAFSCNEMDRAASAVAKVNGGVSALPSYRLPETPVSTALGYEFNYQFDAIASAGDELPNKKIGEIKVKALIEKGEQKCKVLSVIYQDI